MMRGLFRHTAVQTGLARTLGGYLGVIAHTTRWTLDGADPLIAIVGAGRPVILAFWHERLPMIPSVVRLVGRSAPPMVDRPMHVLVSRHRDGRLIGAAVEHFNFRLIHGSTDRGGAAALAAMLRVLRRGEHVSITPDGPRGPRRVAAVGVAQVAAVSGAPVVPVAAATTLHRRLGTWDRMMLPMPFGRGAMVCGTPIAVARDGAAATLPLIEAGLNAVCARADTLCGLTPG